MAWGLAAITGAEPAYIEDSSIPSCNAGLFQLCARLARYTNNQIYSYDAYISGAYRYSVVSTQYIVIDC
ncbi:Glycoside hydrolase, family 76 [Penicillium camemberti]|uniref:Glycoside hydrolase, family 76 n=1 Tax=Penicillium camemberti (strain FM 013) TaxID=1429867 RepID=A0A0G4P576_PENC3|nr:Glycoside hydrolase, family 76 [Penicillium camemberti]